MAQWPSEDVLAAYLLGDLPEEEANAVERALASTPELREQVEAMKRIHGTLGKDARAGREGLSPERRAQLLADATEAISDDRSRPRRKGRRKSSNRIARATTRKRVPRRPAATGWYAAAAVAAVSLVAGILFRSSVRPPARRPAVRQTRTQQPPPERALQLTGEESPILGFPTGGPRHAEDDARRRALAETSLGAKAPAGAGSRPVPEPTPPPERVAVTERPRPVSSQTHPIQEKPVARRQSQPKEEPSQGGGYTVARLVKIQGRATYARGAEGKWLPALEGIALLAGDRLETRAGRVRLVAGRAAIYVNRSTLLRVKAARTDAGEALLVDLHRGEVYIADGGQKVYVETPEGLVRPVGTRFVVRRTLKATMVAVEEGKVEAGTETEGPRPDARGVGRTDLRGRLRLARFVRLEAGWKTQLRRGEEPAAPVPFDAKALKRQSEWTRPLRPVRSSGLIATYYQGLSFEEPNVVARRIDAKIDFTWDQTPPAPKLFADRFCVRWTGFLQAPRSGRYTFAAVSDDGSRLFIDGKPVFDGWFVHIPTRYYGEVELSEGLHEFKLEFFHRDASQGLRICRLFWALEGGFDERVVPPTVLFHNPRIAPIR